MRQLEFQVDAILFIHGIYSMAFTHVTCATGTSLHIPIRKDTIQGDTLSPFLFIIALKSHLK